MSDRIELAGAPGSPYTRKMLALLRYRHIPHAVFWGDEHIPEDYPKPKVPLLPTFYLNDAETGTRQAATDSTPLIRRFETQFKGRSVTPADPVLSFLNDLIEDFADEWLTKAMFHFRWAHEIDAKNAAPLLVYWHRNTLSEADAASFADFFSKRQIDRLYVVGSNATTSEIIETAYARLVGILDRLIARKGFVLGERPSSADFALYGQLTQLAVVEPTSARITRKISPRIRAWIDLMDDLSGLPADTLDWFDRDEAKGALSEILSEIGRTYGPAMLANDAAIKSGQDSFETQIDGRVWTQPVFKYQAKCLAVLRDTHAGLSADQRMVIKAILADTHCSALLD